MEKKNFETFHLSTDCKTTSNVPFLAFSVYLLLILVYDFSYVWISKATLYAYLESSLPSQL